jgi:hypothetical protein
MIASRSVPQSHDISSTEQAAVNAASPNLSRPRRAGRPMVALTPASALALRVHFERHEDLLSIKPDGFWKAPEKTHSRLVPG